MSSYFDLAVALTRAEAAPTLAKLATKYQAIQRIADRDDPAYHEGRRLNREAQVDQETWRAEQWKDEA